MRRAGSLQAYEGRLRTPDPGIADVESRPQAALPLLSLSARPRPPNVFQIKVTVFLSLAVERARGSWRRVGSVESWKRRTEATAEKWEETRHQGRTGGLRRGWGSWRAGSLEVSPIHQVLDSWTRHFCPLLFFHLLAVPGTYSATSACVPNSATMLVSCCDEMNPSRRNTMEDVHVCLRPGTWGAPDPSASFIG